MISFNQFLSEARSAPLYHSANLLRLDSYIEGGGISPNTLQRIHKFHNSLSKKQINKTKIMWGNNVQGISTTRSLRFAKGWKSSEFNVIFVINQQKILHNFKVIPLQYWQSERDPARQISTSNEDEEFIVTDKVLGWKYFDGILISRNHYDSKEVKENLKYLTDKYGRDFVRYYD